MKSEMKKKENIEKDFNTHVKIHKVRETKKRRIE
jgi:hypothetical protein